MKSTFDEPKIFKQTRADGTVFFFSEVVERRTLFWGLLKSKRTLYLMRGPSLTEYESLKIGLESRRVTEDFMKEAIGKYSAEKLRSKVLSYEEV